MERTPGTEEIAVMESILDRHTELLDRMGKLLEEFSESQKDYQRLREYYHSERFLSDMEQADAGELPSDMKCGVLSEDAVFDLIGDNFSTAVRMLEIATGIIKEH